MVRIKNFIDKIYRIIGLQEYSEAKTYRPINYCMKNAINDGELLYNIFTRELIFLKKSEYENSYIKQNKDDLFVFLVKHWYLVPADTDEYSLCYMFKRAYTKAYKNDHLSKIWTYVIMTTTDCNANCFYCYQGGRKRRDMTLEVAKSVIDYINETKAGKPYFHWFGGEPLYNSKVIDLISQAMHDQHISYASTMTSNGYLLHRHDVKKIKKLWRLEKLQITLDGMEDTYNATKSFIYSNNAFEQVLNNIGYALDCGIDVRVRLNLSAQNIDEMTPLVDLLYNRFSAYNNLFIYAHPLFDVDENDTERKVVYKKYLDIQQHICNKGMGEYYPLSQMKVTNCMSDNLSTVVINPEGKLTICEHHSDEEFIGDIYSKEINHKVVEGWAERFYTDECQKCILYPQCTKIKKCATGSCSEEERKYLKEQIKLSMIDAYKKWVEKNEQS